ncbi:tetratricopeptide repeat protein [Algoriphagus sp.]|uniref:tetratricopeptide repeat-containing sensor histidine kinase n=1 Tax=Algoriphagus sp. TaxID=1872435 RepID=UPI00260EABD2|nr:tetratricopeptide repeat protein [Algoriphagus sp.]
MRQFVVFLLFLISQLSFAQTAEDRWVQDSLQLYLDGIEKRIQTENRQEAITLIQLVYNQGEKTLAPEIFDLFSDLIKDTRLQDQPDVLGTTFHYLGNLEFYRGQTEAAKSNFEQALIHYAEGGREKDAAGMAMNLGIIKERQSDYQGAIDSYLVAIPIFSQADDLAGLAVALENLGLAYSYQGEYRKALTYLNETDSVLSIRTDPEDSRWTNLFYNKSNVHLNIGNLDSALNFALKGLRISEKNEDWSQANAGHLYLTKIYERLEDWDNWRLYLNKARDFATKKENKLILAELDYELADYFLDQEQFDSARFYVDRGLAFFDESKQSEGGTRGRILRGRIHFRQENFPQAIADYQEALAVMNSDQSREIASIYHNLGTSYARTGQFVLAEDFLKKALALRSEFGQPNGLRDVYFALADLYARSGNYQLAYESQIAYKQYSDSVLNETRVKQLLETQTAFETEKKDQEIELLNQQSQVQGLKAERQQAQIYLAIGGIFMFLVVAALFYNRSRVKQKANDLLTQKNQKIEKQNQEREMLLKEIHHRVKNNLQIISSLLSMQTRRMNDLKMIDAMKESQSRVKTMALIHEKLYQYDNLSAINMREYLIQLSDFLTQTYRTDKKIQVEIDSEEINLDIDTAIPLGLITNELLSNALKYAFEDTQTGTIKIKLAATGPGEFELLVADTGKGLSQDMDIERSPTLGLRLVNSLTRQINGTMNVQSQGGTSFLIQFKESSLAA